ncbi:acyl dehydratase [Nocardia transvalensis]|uniref:Acyl dehydratase n=1 Tax=Nocardia transvalensis TaxID=37333 RepID=A0A7W9UM72_9NOCA|nr:MaoC/PaaZ C-terminal domain-containing protein [Nocardia transvalensis]MBB5918319.1 acyl dehydratase [Nocardia transvalensis]
MSEDIRPGTVLGERRIHVDRATLVRYSGASGDFNPIHWDERTAKAVDLPDVIAHGMWTMGAAIQLVVDWCGDAGRIESYAAKFTAPVPVPHDGGADIDIGAVVKSVERERLSVDLTATCDGAKVLTRAVATVAIVHSA